MIVHPTGLLVEAEMLGRAGVSDALARLTIDTQCRITTPIIKRQGGCANCCRAIPSMVAVGSALAKRFVTRTRTSRAGTPLCRPAAIECDQCTDAARPAGSNQRDAVG